MFLLSSSDPTMTLRVTSTGPERSISANNTYCYAGEQQLFCDLDSKISCETDCFVCLCKQEELEEYSLRSRGLCLVPMECTLGVAQTNGADIWAPLNTPAFSLKSNSFDDRIHHHRHHF